MKIRIISAAVVLGLVGIALAQQEKPRRLEEVTATKGEPADRAKLRAQLAGLRAEVELLELVHDVDRSVLAEWFKENPVVVSNSERVAKARESVSQAKMMAARLGVLEDLKKQVGDEQAMQSQTEKELAVQSMSIQADGARKKREFVQKTTELNEKRLALDELEKLYKAAG